MRRKTLWISSLVICAAALVSWQASAQIPSLIQGDGERFVVADSAATGPVQGELLTNQFKVFPVETQEMYVVSGGGAPSNGTAAVAEKLIYDNPLGQFAIEVQSGQQVSDDLTFSVKSGCPLSRYRFQFIGKANPNGCGGQGVTCGPLRVEFALFTECPNAGGVPIPGTSGCASTTPGDGCIPIPDADGLTEINFTPSTPVSLPSAVWLGISMSRSGAGIIIGAPALEGFSSDVMDTIAFACNSTAGGFPASPHSSFNASVYGDETCTDTFLTYQNIRADSSGVNEGSNICIADDITLNRTCNMSQLEVAVRGLGRYDVELRRSSASGPVGNCNSIPAFGVSAIPGTRTAFGSGPGDGLFVYRKNFDPPVPLPNENLFAVLMPNNVNARWVLTRKDASIGSTDASYFVFDGTASGGTWNAKLPSGNLHGGFHIVITCEGAAPIGACCDQYIRDAAGEAVCRDVPEINCPFPPKNTALRPAWAENVPCRVCSGGQRNGLACRADDECLAPRCVNGANHNLACTGPADCPNGTCEPGVCVDNDPFVLPCGLSACCQPSGECANTTLNDCNLVLPITAPRIYDLGQFCNQEGQRCPNPACLAQEGDCLLPRPSRCNGGADDGVTCNSDASCAGGNDGTCDLLATPQCQGGDHANQACNTDLDCIPGGFCTASRCTGGARSGNACEFPRDCRESFCEAFVGCSDPFCCSDVCSFSPGTPVFSEFCCQVAWDGACASLAQQVCTLAPSNDDCAPGDRKTGSSGAVEILVNGLSVSTDATFADVRGDPPEYLLVDPVCCNGGQRRCVGGCADGAVCNDDFDCVGSGPGYCNFGGDPLTGACIGGCNSQAQCVVPGDPNGPKTSCVGGANNQLACAPRCEGGQNVGLGCGTDADCPGSVCAPNFDCPGGFCDNAFCAGTADGFCDVAQPEPGVPGFGSVWYYFTVPDGVGDTLDVEVSTCGSSSPAKDSMVQVFAIGNSDSGLCTETGRCAGDNAVCNVVAQDCADGTLCEDADVTCSIAAQDCPTGNLCMLNKAEACDSLTLIGCNDDAPDGCGSSTQALNSKLCLPNLRRGDTYYILVSAKTEATVGKYRVSVRSVSACDGEAIGTCVSSLCVGGAFDGDACVVDADCAFPVEPANDACPFAEDLVDLDGDNQIVQRFNVGGATQDCRAPSCLGNMKNDVWYRYTPAATGQLIVSTCGGSNATTPDTELIIYDGCDCGAGLKAEEILNQELCCSAIGDPFDCLPGSECDIQVVEGNCYLMRLGDNSGLGAKGDMNITLVPDTGCPAGTVTWVDPQAGTIDARYAKDCNNAGAALGIDTITVTGPAGADPAICWSLCEASDGGLGPNSIASVVEGTPGSYTITLSRPITPGSCTTITYDPTASGGPAQTVKISSLPADVSADGTAGPSDILELIDILNGVATSAWGAYSTDVDVSGATGAADILAVIDLLNGAGCFDAWNSITVETGNTCGTCPVATP